MRIYVYYCDICNTHIELFAINPADKKDDKDIRCEKCGNQPKRIFNTPLVMYTTDNQKENQ